MDIKIHKIGREALLFTPYNAEFVSAIKNIGGAHWDKERRAWSIPSEAIEQARDIMRRVYGACDLPDDQPRVSVKLTFDAEVSKKWSPVTIYSKTIASATGRDSGARTGDDVVFVEGKPQSGGSVKNWYTVVPEGSVVVLHNVPQAALDMPLPDGVHAVVSAQKQSRDDLLAEKERLLARLAEIEKLLEVN